MIRLRSACWPPKRNADIVPRRVFMNDECAPFPLRLSLILCGLMVSAPFLNPYHYYPILSFYTEWLAFAIGLAALGAIALAQSRNVLSVPGMSIGLFLLTALLVLQVARGEVAYPLRSAMGALYAIWAGLLVMLGAWLRSELGEALVSRALQWWFAVAGVLAAASWLIQYYHIPLPSAIYTTTQPINAMIGTLISVAFLYARDALRALPTLLAALPLVVGMTLSGSRSSWGYVLIVFALVPLLRLSGRTDEAKRVLQFWG